MKSIPIILLGCGGVGRELLRHIIACRDLHFKQGLRLRVIGVSDSRSLLIVSDPFLTELDDHTLIELCRAKSSGAPLSSLTSLSHCELVDETGDLDPIEKAAAEVDVSRLIKKDSHCQILCGLDAIERVPDIAGLLGRSTGLAVVDCSASSETVEILKHVVDLGCCVVLANKKPLTCDIEDFENLVMHFRRIRFESTVGAGLPVIVSVNRVISSGDTIIRIAGSLSGTLGYVMSEVEDGKLFSEVVRTARDQGFTEPDPRDDLSGIDVARKVLILARLLGQRIDMKDIEVESLYPAELGPSSMSTADFLKSGLLTLDTDISDRVRTASSNGNALRYVCTIEGPRCRVGLRELPKDTPLGRLRGSDNMVEIYSRCYQDSPLVIQGAGAGNDTTAAGVLADIVDLRDLFH